uniref:Uncharacterized protein n=1 Tax=Timema shepardi TaxID=629360 RepID=A0A7R9FZU6_TIMSH|nr:unnamed protein product [Timema shepardi]
MCLSAVLAVDVSFLVTHGTTAWIPNNQILFLKEVHSKEETEIRKGVCLIVAFLLITTKRKIVRVDTLTAAEPQVIIVKKNQNGFQVGQHHNMIRLSFMDLTIIYKNMEFMKLQQR